MNRRHPHKENVLLVNITRLGDMLQATPTIAGMKLENENCRVTVLVEKQFESVCHAIPNIDEVLSIDLAMTVRSLSREQDGIVDAYEYIGEIVEELRSRNFDYVLNMSSSAYTALLLQLLGVPRRGGWSSDDEGYRIIESEWARLFATSVFHQNRQYNSLNLVDVFRCSADVEAHPKQLLLNVADADKTAAQALLTEASFTNTGPLVVIQAGASQAKRQWAPSNFIQLIQILINEHNVRIVLTGTSKELSIVTPIAEALHSPNVFVAAGKTSIPVLGALLEASDLLITGDTGPMHMSVAVGTPVISMFLASAYGFETGPYSEGNIILQPVIGCGPCNPNKPCSKPDCHFHIPPELIARLAAMRLACDFRSLPDGIADASRVIVYRSFFDEHGFCDLEPLNTKLTDPMQPYRHAYRRLWLDDIGGLETSSREAIPSGSALKTVTYPLQGVEVIIAKAQEGAALIERLKVLIADERAPGHLLGEVSSGLSDVDRSIEETGYHYPHLGPLSRMFLFAKENILGPDALELASQMGSVYGDLQRRAVKLSGFMTR